jgi:hypothetical protein
VAHCWEFWLAYATHVPFAFVVQHPEGHDAASQAHAPEEHSWPEAQAAHALPPVPQNPALAAWHWPFASQHPLGHDVASHVHL